MNNQSNSAKGNKCAQPKWCDLDNLYIFMITKTVQYWHLERQINQWNRKMKVQKVTHFEILTFNYEPQTTQ